MRAIQNFTPDKIAEYIEYYGPKVLFAIVCAFTAWIVAKLITRAVMAALHKTGNDKLSRFVCSILRVLIYAAAVMLIMQTFGINPTTVVALFGALGVAVSLAVKDLLTNLAQGAVIMVVKPFKPGDFIEAGGILGTVHSIEFNYVRLLTRDNKTVLIPNGELAKSKIVNYNAASIQCVEIPITESGEPDLNLLREKYISAAAQSAFALQSPEAELLVSELVAGGVKLILRVWVKSEHYWKAYYDLREKVLLSGRDN